MKRLTIKSYARAIGVADFFVLLFVCISIYLLNYGSLFSSKNFDELGLLRFGVSPQAVGTGLGFGWLAYLGIFKSRDTKIIGSDFVEYRRVLSASLSVLGTLAFFSLFFKVDVSRVYVSEVIVFGHLLLVLERKLGSMWLLRQRKAGKLRRRVAIYGSSAQVESQVANYNSRQEAEFEPVLTLEGVNHLKVNYIGSTKTKAVPLEVLGEFLSAEGIELLQVVGSGPGATEIHRRLYWALDGQDISFVVSPAITGVSSAKLSTRVVAGAPQLEISSTKFTGRRFVIKTCMDTFLGLIAFLISLPIVLVTALIVKLEDKGPAFFKQTRVGVNGKEFTMYKLRSMRVGAELEHAARQKELADKLTNSNMFKDPEDPRVTRVGKVIRKYSIDELPQFLNVLKGDMSMVGPRPPLPSEVEEWKNHETRRLLVKPGVTGPWQIGGRSLLTWEETVAIDLNYVENWSVLTDLSIIFKTVVFVIRGKGAF
jgi:exopolysaccharide biosynthesis polyprenyl glycosylphosphotransferase